MVPGRVLGLRRSAHGEYGTTLVASQDRQRLYEFNGIGRHTRTIHGFTGQTLLNFEYDTAGRLTAVVDGDAQRTTIERSSNGDPQAIVAPFGQRTELTLDGHGYLATIKPDPNHPAYRFTYRPDGLMTQLIDPAGSTLV
ncbi:MAG TPA: hypothetical protein VFN67_28805 [Polyangiales bacterium]|nr:hypothetical protein [Polyangiales bacterium]